MKFVAMIDDGNGDPMDGVIYGLGESVAEARDDAIHGYDNAPDFVVYPCDDDVFEYVSEHGHSDSCPPVEVINGMCVFMEEF